MPGKQKEFLQEIVKASGLSTKKLAQLVKIHPRSFLDWKKEKLRMSLKAVELFEKKFGVKPPESKEVIIDRWEKSLSLVAKIGGIARYKKYGGLATKEGRKRGGVQAMEILRQRGLVPQRKFYKHPNKSILLAELVGIMLGDGGITPSYCAVTLNSKADKEYSAFVSTLEECLFGNAPSRYKRNNENTLILYYNGIDLVEYLLSMGLKIGNKVKQQVDVPRWIKEKKEYRIACLRGLMDTDGMVFNHRYKSNGKEYSYLKLNFTNKSMPLIIFVLNTLREIGLNPKRVERMEIQRVWLYNAQEVKQYLKIVGSSNERLLKYNKEASHSLVH